MNYVLLYNVLYILFFNIVFRMSEPTSSKVYDSNTLFLMELQQKCIPNTTGKSTFLHIFQLTYQHSFEKFIDLQ